MKKHIRKGWILCGIGLITILLSLAFKQPEILIILTDIFCCILMGSCFIIITYTYRYDQNANLLSAGMAALGVGSLFFIQIINGINHDFWSKLNIAALAGSNFLPSFSLILFCFFYQRKAIEEQNLQNMVLTTASITFSLGGLIYLLPAFVFLSPSDFLFHSTLISLGFCFLTNGLLKTVKLSISEDEQRLALLGYLVFSAYLFLLALSLIYSVFFNLAYITKLLSFGIFYTACVIINLKEPYRNLYYEITAVNKELVEKSLEVESKKEELRSLFQKLYQLEQLSVMGELAASVSHEVRNPLTSIRGYLQIFLNDEDCKKHEKPLVLMIEEVDRITQIITDYLAIGKKNPSEVPEIRKNINQIIKNQAFLLECDAVRKGQKLRLDLHPVSDTMIYERSLVQLLLNLCRNGFEAMGTGGVLTISTYMQENTVVVSVQDEGPGIPEEIMGLIDQPFFTTKEKGTGLGLPICFRIAAQHNAVMDVKNNSSGACFTICFPIPEASEQR